jgi:hypothetical protein
LDPSHRQPFDNDADPRFERTPAPGSAPRQILDILVQSCTVELFHALGVAVAPRAQSRTGSAPREHFDLVGSVAFSDPKANGTLLLSFEDAVYGLLSPPATSSHAKHDALRELTNQLIGRIKNRLLQFELALRIGLPSATRKQVLSRQLSSATPFAAYLFRTLRGDIVVTVIGSIDEGSINYTGRVQVAKEGDFIPF